MGTLGTHSRTGATTTARRTIRALAAIAAGLLLAGCSTERIMETALEQVDGVGDVDFDAEGGNFSVTNEDGEEFAIEVDAETGASTMRTDEGEVSTRPVADVPPAVAEAVTLPDGFQPVSLSEGDIDGGTQVMLQGEISGGFDDLLAQIEEGVRAGGWAHVERQAMFEGQQAMVVGQDDAEDSDSGVMVSLIMTDADAGEGMIQVVLVRE